MLHHAFFLMVVGQIKSFLFNLCHVSRNPWPPRLHSDGEKGGENEEVLAIHRNISIIIPVMSSDSMVDVPKLAGLCKDTYLQNLNNFAWVSISKSLHSLLGNVPELIDRNGGRGLLSLSE